MRVIIGHSSIDERGKISGGQAGDQTGKEVCKRTFYNHKKGWICLRAKDKNIANKIATCMEDICDNPYVGYDQSQRLDLYNAVKDNNFKCDKESLKKFVECDCSSSVRVCLAYAGVMVSNFNTSNERKVIFATGLFEEVTVKSDGSNLKRGDILVTKTKGHTVVVISNSNYSNKVSNESEEYNMPTISYGSKGRAVKVWQIILGFTGDDVDGDFGKGTKEKTFKWQENHSLKVDGIVGKNSWKAGLESL